MKRISTAPRLGIAVAALAAALVIMQPLVAEARGGGGGGFHGGGGGGGFHGGASASANPARLRAATSASQAGVTIAAILRCRDWRRGSPARGIAACPAPARAMPANGGTAPPDKGGARRETACSTSRGGSER